MTSTNAKQAADVAEEYYDSSDADSFYFAIWGGEDIHIGIYSKPDEDIKTASRRTVATMAEMLVNVLPESTVIDLGSGYGGAARYLASTYGCNVVCVNISETQNAVNRRLNTEQGLAGLIDVKHGSFEDVPAGAESCDFVWSQDAFLHSADRERVLREAWRVLKPGGYLIFTDPMQADDCPAGVLAPILERIHLSSMGSFAYYTEALEKLGFAMESKTPMVEHLRTHYFRVGQELERNLEKLPKITPAFAARMLAGLNNWVKGADQGHLAWGIILARKPEASDVPRAA